MVAKYLQCMKASAVHLILIVGHQRPIRNVHGASAETMWQHEQTGNRGRELTFNREPYPDPVISIMLADMR